jgi:hypothetical protein
MRPVRALPIASLRWRRAFATGSGPTPGVYNIVVIADSTSGTFNHLAAVRETIL